MEQLHQSKKGLHILFTTGIMCFQGLDVNVIVKKFILNVVTMSNFNMPLPHRHQRLCLKQYLSLDSLNFSEHSEPFQVHFPQNWKGPESKFLILIQLVRTKDI